MHFFCTWPGKHSHTDVRMVSYCFFGQRHVFLLVRKTRRDWGCWHDEISDDVGDRSVGSIPDVPDDVPFFALESDKNGWFIN